MKCVSTTALVMVIEFSKNLLVCQSTHHSMQSHAQLVGMEMARMSHMIAILFSPLILT